MSRSSRLVFLCLALFLILWPLAVHKPGLPQNLKSDEAAYYLMALSLVHDRDLKCGLEDIHRLTYEFPYQAVENLILETDDGWKSAFFGKPYLYSALGAPWVAMFGADGLVAFNMALLVGAIGLGALYLRQYNSDSLALLYSAGFHLLSNGFAYVFWMHTEVLNMASVAACLFLAFTEPPRREAPGVAGRFVARFWNESTRPWFSGAALAVGTYNKPVLALLGLAPLWKFARGRGWRAGAAWVGGAVLAMAAICGVSVALTGHPTAYLGVARGGFKIEDFDRLPFTSSEVSAAASAAAGADDAAPPNAAAREEKVVGAQNDWGWIFKLPEIDRRTPRNLAYFLWGRHTGLVLYMPFAVLSTALFLFHARRSKERWALLGGLAAIAFFFLWFIPFNWHGGGGFIGNRYYVTAYPAFLYLATRIAPAWLPALGYAWGGLYLGQIFFTPFGAPVPQPTLQSHVRNAPFRLFPYEIDLGRQIPGYRGGAANDVWFTGRRDVFLPRRDEMWVEGGSPVEIWARSDRPIERPVFLVESEAPTNRVTIEIGGDRKVVTLDPDHRVSRVTMAPRAPSPATDWDGERFSHVYTYRMLVTATEKQVKSYRQAAQPESEESGFFVGVILTYLGTEAELAQDLYHVAWESGSVPPRIAAGDSVTLAGRLRNTSAVGWRPRGPTRVSLSYHWLDPAGKPIVWEGARTFLAGWVNPGATADVEISVTAPPAPGRYLLELDLVRERVTWFSARNPGSTYRVPVEIVAPAAPGAPPPAAAAGGSAR
ncbi:MAG: hypothetical protein U0X73_08585 [Thermoanaerobaculia bacterium]